MKKTNLPFLIFSLLALLILFPLLTPGYIQTFDMPWGPIRRIPEVTNNTWLLSSSLAFIYSIVPSWLVQKSILFLIIFLGGLGAFRVAGTQLSSNKSVFKIPPLHSAAVGMTNGIGQYFAGVLYIFNPFFYTRFITGQWLVLCGYVVLPWVVYFFWQMLEKPNRKSLIAFIISSCAISFTSVHTIAFVLILSFCLTLVHGIQNCKQKLAYISLAMVIFLSVNSIWLIPTILGRTSIATTVAQVTTSQFKAFSPKPTIGNVELSTLLLEGFWADDQQQYLLPSSVVFIWVPATALLFLIIILGIITIIQKKDKLGIALLLCGLIGWLLSMGLASPLSADITTILRNTIPFYSGYRDTHKWLMLTALAYSYSSVFGLSSIRDILDKKNVFQHSKNHPPQTTHHLLIVLTCLLPLFYCAPLLWGLSGQLRSADYPTGWYSTQSYLEETHAQTVIVFPWHMYLPLSFTGRTTANPARHFFTTDVIMGNNPEIQGLANTKKTELENIINYKIIPNKKIGIAELETLSEFHVTHVMLLKEADWEKYAWLDAEPNLTVVNDNESIRLYRVEQTAD